MSPATPKTNPKRRSPRVRRVATGSAEAFLRGLPARTRRLAAALRAVVHGTVPDACESVLWGGLSYHRPEVGGRVKGAVCQIVVKKGVVRLDFIHGIRLRDPSGLLVGDRVSKRFVPIGSAADARRPEIAALIRDAGALDPTRWQDEPA